MMSNQVTPITIADNAQLLSEESIKYVKKNILEPELINDIRKLSTAPRYWRTTANVSQTLSQIFVGVNIILSFTSTGMHMPILSILAGIVGTIAIVLAQFSSFSEKESKESNMELNILLTKVLHVDAMPDLVVDDDKKNSDIEQGQGATTREITANSNDNNYRAPDIADIV